MTDQEKLSQFTSTLRRVVNAVPDVETLAANVATACVMILSEKAILELERCKFDGGTINPIGF